MKMLIIEDDANLSNSIGMSLINLKIVEPQDLFKAFCLSEALEIREFITPSVILLDLNLPDSSGGESFFKIKKIFGDSSIIILTGTNDSELALELVLAGAHDFLSKTDLKNVLLSRVIKSAEIRYNLILECQESEHRLNDIISCTPIPLVTVNRFTNRYSNVNEAFLQLTGFSLNTIIKNNSGTYSEQLELLRSEIISRSNSKNKSLFHFTNCHSEQKLVDIQVNEFNENEIVAMITDRTSEVEFEKKKNALIMDVEEAERKILSRELHDGIAQNHILMHLLIETLPITEDVRMQLKPVEDVIKKSLEETISISYRLNPPDLRDGLEAGLVSLIQNVNSTGILSCSLAFDCEILEMDLQTTEILNIYRIVQEFINNSIKYSGCKTIEIVFQRRDENEIYLLIKDDGKGFDKINHKSKGLGTENIMHRLEILNFKGLYESEVGKGTWIEGVFCLNDLVFSHD